VGGRGWPVRAVLPAAGSRYRLHAVDGKTRSIWRRAAAKIVQTTTLVIRGWNHDDGAMLCAAMAFFAAFSIFPLCLVLIASLGVAMRIVPGAHDAQKQLIDLAAQNASPWLADQVAEVLAQVKTSAGVGGPIGLVTLLVGAIGVFTQFESMLARIWKLPGPRPSGILAAIRAALLGRAVAFVMLLVLGAVLIVMLVANVILSAVEHHATGIFANRIAWSIGRLVITVAANAAIFTLIYRTLPKASVRRSDALAGGVLVAIVWEVGQRLLSVFVIGERFSPYGVVGAFIAILSWTYYASAVLFLGAELVQVLGAQRQQTPAQLDPRRG